ncbi:hypothetical protein [Smaragdicoccus niigatensis]|uniref:hypothetical protein n=1 Tax=Smaragdicoccus niigatensis TaxID=359359 RepID=UPI00035E279A|nr:hypothetical protein [Smaragdicoccus niigatensis]
MDGGPYSAAPVGLLVGLAILAATITFAIVRYYRRGHFENPAEWSTQDYATPEPQTRSPEDYNVPRESLYKPLKTEPPIN